MKWCTFAEATSQRPRYVSLTEVSCRHLPASLGRIPIYSLEHACRRSAKAPHLCGWTRFRDDPPQDKELRQPFAHPNGDVCIVLRRGILILYTNLRSAGVESLQSLQAEDGARSTLRLRWVWEHRRREYEWAFDSVPCTGEPLVAAPSSSTLRSVALPDPLGGRVGGGSDPAGARNPTAVSR